MSDQAAQAASRSDRIVHLIPRDEIGLPSSILYGGASSDAGFLACHVLNEEPTWALHAAPGQREVLKVPLRYKIEVEIDYWVKKLLQMWKPGSNDDRRGHRRTHRHMPQQSIARAIRVLKALELLLLDFESRTAPAWKSHQSWLGIEPFNQILSWDEADATVGQSDPAAPRESAAAITPIVTRSIQGSFDDRWGISWPLLTVRAAAWCLIAWEQPYLWEAHSALKAQQDHSVRNQMSENEIKCLAYLIRFQSAPGQFDRMTGDDRFFQRAEKLGLDDVVVKDLLMALGLLAHAQDFRNRPLHIDVEADDLRKILLQEGHVNPHSAPTGFERFWNEFTFQIAPNANGGTITTDARATVREQTRPETPGKTWSYSDFFLRNDNTSRDQSEERREILARFRQIVESRIRDRVAADGRTTDLRLEEIVGYSFGRDFMDSAKLKRTLTHNVCEVVDHPDRFEELFQFEAVYIPDCFDPGQREAVMLVRLADHVTARHMVYSDTDRYEPKLDSDEFHPVLPLCERFAGQQKALTDYIPDIDLSTTTENRASRLYRELFGLKPKKTRPRQNRKDVYRAWRLFEYLFLEGIGTGMIRWAQTQPSENYCPTYLIGSMLHACYRIAPDCCLSFPVEVDGEPAASIRLPIIPDSAAPDAPAVKAVARYVGAFAVNKLMARRVKSIRIGLRNLEKGRPEHAKTEAGRFWRKAIRREYDANALAKFLGDYADNFLMLINHVEFDAEAYPMPEFLEPESTDPIHELETLLNSLARETKDEVVLAGIDVGGTYTKFSFYSLCRSEADVDLRRWPNYPESFKIETGVKDEPYNGATPFCERLLTEIDQQLKSCDRSLADIDALGITWPGPVRDNHVREWSGILRKFRNRDGAEFGTDLRELMSLDIVGAMQDLLRRRTRRTVPVAMINDGDSHAIGEIYRMLIRKQSDAEQFRGTTALVKAGTGTAGAVARSGRLIGGLMEFGKLIVNLAYDPTRRYPTGLASRFCSARTLPALACATDAHLLKLVPKLTSIEVGLLAGLAGIGRSHSDWQATNAKGRRAQDEHPFVEFKRQFRRLMCESGTIAFAARLPDAIDAAELGQLLDGKWAERPESRMIVEAEFGRVGDHAFKELCERIHRHGIIRLEAILQLDTARRRGDDLVPKREHHQVDGKKIRIEDDVECLNYPATEELRLNSSVVEKIESAARMAEQCVSRLGDFLGDLAALLYSEHRMEWLVFGGGVLSGDTGRSAIARAAERIDDYSRFDAPQCDLDQSTIHFRRLRESDAIRESGPPTASARVNASEPAVGEPIDPGTYGVAAQAAIRYLLQKRWDGLNEIRTLVEGLTLTHQLVLTGPSDDQTATVEVMQRMGIDADGSGETPEPIRLEDFALDEMLVRQYLDRHGQDLGIIRSPSSGEAQNHRVTTYTRWMRR